MCFDFGSEFGSDFGRNFGSDFTCQRPPAFDNVVGVCLGLPSESSRKDWTDADRRAETNNVSACYALAKVSSKLYGLHSGTRIAALTADAEMA